MLAEAGFNRYEVSAFAQSGRQCRHNLNYWSFGDYLGVGAGAHGKLSPAVHRDQSTVTVRTSKASQPRLYLLDPTSTTSEQISTEALPGEFMLNALRLREGLGLDRFASATALSLAALEPSRSLQISDGLLRADRIATTERGYAMLDSLIQAYL
jgi:oxygen-independent coproporphyrinogen-3 oxidase